MSRHKSLNMHLISLVVASSSFSPALSGCFVTGSTKLLSINWILLTTMDFVILCLTIVQGIQQCVSRPLL